MLSFSNASSCRIKRLREFYFAFLEDYPLKMVSIKTCNYISSYKKCCNPIGYTTRSLFCDYGWSEWPNCVRLETRFNKNTRLHYWTSSRLILNNQIIRSRFLWVKTSLVFSLVNYYIIEISSSWSSYFTVKCQERLFREIVTGVHTLQAFLIKSVYT